MAVIALSRERRSADAERPQGLTEAELHRVVEEQTGALLGLARHFSPSTEDARDAVQSGLEILLRHRHRVGAEWVGPWLHTVVRRCACAGRAAAVSPSRTTWSATRRPRPRALTSSARGSTSARGLVVTAPD